MAGLTTAWALSAPGCRDAFEVTVYERDYKLGGKGASTRGEHGRIEEHGLHVWLGYYDNAFRLMREVYEELDRDPASPVATWRDAFLPAGRVGVADFADGSWSNWVAGFGANDSEPGVPSGPSGPATVLALIQRGLRLLLDFSASLDEREQPAVVISAVAAPRRRGPAAVELTRVFRRAEIAGLVAAVESLQLVRGTIPGVAAFAPSLLSFLDRMHAELLARLQREPDARRSWQVADLVIACLRGSVRDGLVGGADAFATIDHLDFREWLDIHGASPATLESPLVRGMYDLVFAYEDGDPERPRFAAGLGLFLAAKLFFDYKGAIFWKLRAGMGEIVFAPLYEALRARGVRFAFAHRVERLELARDARRVAAIALSADPAGRDLDPLVNVNGLPCFPTRAAPEPGRPLRLAEGADFDAVVLAAPLGTAPEICAELIADSPAWRELVRRVATVGTQSFQLWTRADERELGWPHPGATVSGYVTPFDTYASMSHVLDLEDWPAAIRPRAVGYFCSVLAGDASVVEGNVERFLAGPVERFWPGYRPEQVVARYVRANVEPSERYVQSLPGTGGSRLPADGSGYDNLFLAGDWIDSGLNAGCIEAAVLSGLEAANAVRGLPLLDGVLGTWCEPSSRLR